MTKSVTKFIFITGGVVSSLGKGLASASIGTLLQSRSYSVRLKKLDPYLNVDPGTMSPYQHGEVFVTDDGAETDLDLGHYERFTGVPAKKGDNITAGRIYSDLISKERKGDYLGITVQVIPHVTELIKNFIVQDTEGIDFVLCEIGGTVGDIEGLPFFESIRQLGQEMGRDRVIYIHLTLLPYIKMARELKTKPTQHSVKELRSIGIQPDVVLCRADREVPKKERDKISLFCNIKKECVIQAIDQKNVYFVPLAYHQEGLDNIILKHFNMDAQVQPNLDHWRDIIHNIENPKGEVTIAVVGKYNKVRDAYKSLIEAFEHAGINQRHKVKLLWVNSEVLTEESIEEKLSSVDAIMVPGGFGIRGTEGKILAIKYARENKIPFFGICLGLQLALIEIARNLLSIKDATSGEFGIEGTKIIEIMEKWYKGDNEVIRTKSVDMGGSMRLGAYPCMLQHNSRAFKIYDCAELIHERHRHRYEVDISFKERFEQSGVVFSGMSPSGDLTEIVELESHPWFIGVQFHPELKSKPFKPHPLFISFIEAAIKKQTRI